MTHLVNHLVEPPLVHFELHQLAQHRLGEHRQLVAETPGHDPDPLATLIESERELGEVRLVCLLGDRVGKHLGKKRGEDMVPGCGRQKRATTRVRERKLSLKSVEVLDNPPGQLDVHVGLGEPPRVVALVPQPRERRVFEQVRSERLLLHLKLLHIEALRDEGVWRGEVQFGDRRASHGLLS